MIDLVGIMALRAVDTEGSVAGAATALGFTPSAVSQQVKRLERDVGAPLLERVGRGVALTEDGRRLVVGGGDVMAALERLQANLQSPGRPQGVLRVQAFSTAMRGLVAPVVRELLDEHPDLDLVLTEAEPWQAIDAVARGRCDLAVVHSWGDVPLVVPPHLVAHPTLLDEAHVIVRRDHPLAGRARIRAQDLATEAWIATPEGTICREWLNRMHAGAGAGPRVAHVAMEFESHVALVSAGLGIALIPRLGRAPLPDDLTAVPVIDPVPTRDVQVLHRESMGTSPAVRAVVEALAVAARVVPGSESARR